ncbi:cell wall-binding repeat-containing protein [Herbiconiux sp. P15]|uniref:cell wall-binding repeat-containing protein n=1 Tax=Herbiconiux liukaitaii TaxID=3342799 RepID=UPI0035B7DC21
MAALLLLGGLAVPPATAEEIAPPAPLALTQSPTPETDTISASWGTRAAGSTPFIVAPGVSSISLALPAELSARFGDAWSYQLNAWKGATLAEGAVAASSGVVIVPTAAVPSGTRELTIRLTNTVADPTTQVTLYAAVDMKSGSPSPSPIPLSRATAWDWGHHITASAAPEDSTVTPGSLITLVSPPGTSTKGPDGDWSNPSPVRAYLSAADGLTQFGTLPTTVSADGSTLTMQIRSVPENSYWPYFPNGEASRQAVLNISMLEGPIINETGFGGTLQVSTPITLIPAAKPTIERVEGPDRYSVAVQVSEQAFPQGADTVFVVTGANYPDALSAGPAAVHRDAPLLLTQTDALPAGVASEITRLSPDDIYVVGGVNSVSENVIAKLKTTGAAVHRIGGADRYAASRALAADTFGAGEGSGLAYIATGQNFPDALAAGGAAGHVDAPVILVNGGAVGLDDATQRQLVELGITRIKIAGGPASVSEGIERDLGLIAPTTRLWGADRFAAAAAVNLDAYGASDRAFLVTGSTFPDALSGSAWAGRLGAPLFVSRGECVPSGVADAMARQGVTDVTLIGGPASLSPAVESYTLCDAR